VYVCTVCFYVCVCVCICECTCVCVCVCVCSLSHRACNAHLSILSSVVCPALQYFSTSSHKRHDFQENVINHEMTFRFPLYFFFETFLSLRRNERDMVKKMSCGLQVKCVLFLSEFNGT